MAFSNLTNLVAYAMPTNAGLKHLYFPARESEELLPGSEISEDNTPEKHARHLGSTPRTSSIFTRLALIFFMSTTVLFLIALTLRTPSQNECIKKLSTYSPLIDVVEYEDVEFTNPFAHQTVYRGPPTPQLEAAWKKLWYFNGVEIPAENMSLLNRTAGPRYKSTDGGKTYHALIEVFHQIHCLNLIRQYTWRDWYRENQDIVPPPHDLLDSDIGARMHVDHCIEALRISLMCHGDTTPFLVKMDPDSPVGAEADFSPHHKCVKFDPLLNYMETHSPGASSTPESLGHELGHGHSGQSMRHM